MKALINNVSCNVNFGNFGKHVNSYEFNTVFLALNLSGIEEKEQIAPEFVSPQALFTTASAIASKASEKNAH